MCGIVAVLGRKPQRSVPTSDEVLAGLHLVLERLSNGDPVADALQLVDALLRGVPGIQCVDADATLKTSIRDSLATIDRMLSEREALDDDDGELVALRDAWWAIGHDRLRTAETVIEFAGHGATEPTLTAYLSVQRALSALDRLEVRGRDSAGLHLMVDHHGLNRDDPAVANAIEHRSHDPLFQSASVRWIDTDAGPVLSFVYKAAAEIGELGDNTAAIRHAIQHDTLLRHALSGEGVSLVVLGHTRWASVGVISEANAHPLNSEELEAPGGPAPYVVGVLNGDVDNHAEIAVEHGLRVHEHITTDAKVIPTVVARRLADGVELVEAFRRSVAEFEGSVAIGAMSSSRPNHVVLALRGSGQGVYVGLSDDCYVVASEPYGVVEEATRYVRLEGEHGGEILVIDGAAGDLDGLRRLSYDGTDLPITDDDVIVAEVTTRDIDRGDAPHFLLKEINESPRSLQRTLRGRIDESGSELSAALPESSFPASLRSRLAEGLITRVRVIGQGTAAVAGQGVAAILNDVCEGALDVDAITATELSGFQLHPDMSDTLVIAVSQSGTTTDTNRTVDLLRARGALVLAIVNRRASDLAVKSDGVIYTSDGRDVEMSVASTKAFYAQVAAGAILSCAIADAAQVGNAARRSRLLGSLRSLPAAMSTVLERRSIIADAAHRYAPLKRYWAVVGNGPNLVAANEVRIKLSELCYKSIASDVTEDKKHIDLSSEPLIFVCAAGLHGSTADDVAKETAIFRAHKATPIVVADEGESRFSGVATIPVPAVDPALAFLLSSMVGHLFGYEAARSIDLSALPLRRARETVERAVSDGMTGDDIVTLLSTELDRVLVDFEADLRSGRYDGHLEASTAVHLVRTIGFFSSTRPIEEFSTRSGKVGTPGLLIEELVAALTAAIDELTRPIDAIKHQAKTVTVGISRSDSDVIDNSLVRETLGCGAGRDVLSYRVLKVLASLDPAVAQVAGFTRYAIEGETISIVDRGGIARDLASRVDSDPRLGGTKRYVADTREVLVAKGRRDGRVVILVPESKGGTCTGITLLHVALHARLSVADARQCLQGYDNRYERLVDWVTETEGEFDEAVLTDIDVAELLIAPISETANNWMK